MIADWRAWSPDERERQVSPSSMIGGNYLPFIERYESESVSAVDKANPPARLHVTVPATGQLVDVFPPPQEGGPVLVYIHGGYWQELARSYSRFAGAALQRAGWGCVVVGYPLAPRARIGEMIDVCAEAIRWTKRHLHPHRVVVSGSSAGGHLAACAAALPGVHVDALLLMSGVYNLDPLIGTSVDAALDLTPEEARELSPLHRPPAHVQTLLTWGEHETPWFKDMNHLYAIHLHAYEIEAKTYESPDRNHFDIVFDLCDPGSKARRWLETEVR